MSGQSRKGHAWENACEGYWRDVLGDAVHVERLHGSRDEGDIHGLSSRGRGIVAECKNCRDYRFPEWVAEAEAEAANAGADFGVVLVKRRGRGVQHVGGHWALMSIDTFAGIIGGAPSEMAETWGGSKSALAEKVSAYAREIGRPVEEVLVSLLHSAIVELEVR